MKKLKIRRAKPKDYKEIAKLRKDTFNKINSKDYTKKQVKKLHKENPPEIILKKMKEREMFCFVDKKKILGVIDLEKNKIGGFFIHHKHIKKGLGKELLNFIENHARKKGIKKVLLYSTKYAKPFYEKYSYKTIKNKKERKKKYAHTYLMEKMLI